MRDLLNVKSPGRSVGLRRSSVFCYQVKKQVGAFAGSSGRTRHSRVRRGIGENAPSVRARICDGLGFLGIELEEKRNAGR